MSAHITMAFYALRIAFASGADGIRLWQKREKRGGNSMNKYYKALYNRRKAQGLCIECGWPAVGGRVRCKKCAVRNSERCYAYYHRKDDSCV